MYGYRLLTKEEKAEQKAENQAGLVWMGICVIIATVVFICVSHNAGLITGAVTELFVFSGFDFSDHTDTDSGTCGE